MFSLAYLMAGWVSMILTTERMNEYCVTGWDDTMTSGHIIRLLVGLLLVSLLESITSSYRSTIQFITQYEKDGWSSLTVRWNLHMYVLIYKPLLIPFSQQNKRVYPLIDTFPLPGEIPLYFFSWCVTLRSRTCRKRAVSCFRCDWGKKKKWQRRQQLKQTR